MMDGMELELSLKDLFYRVLKQWRGVIFGAVILALALGLGRFGLGMLSLLNPEKQQEAQSAYENALAGFEARGEQLKKTIENTKDRAEYQSWYNENSVMMKIDPESKWSGSLVLYVDSGYKIDPALTYQTPDYTGRLISAYSGYLGSSEIYNLLLEKLDYVNDLSLLQEIYSATGDTGSATITVAATGRSEAEVQQILDLAYNYLLSKQETVTNTVGEHTCTLLRQSVTSTKDRGLDEAQKENRLAIQTFAQEIGDAQQELEKWGKEEKPKAEFGFLHTLKQTIKLAILGGVAGVFLMLAFYIVAYIVSNNMKVDEDWKLFGLPVLGHLYRDREKRAFWKVDRWLDRLFLGRAERDRDQSCRLTAKNLAALMRQRGMSRGILTGEVEEDFARTAVELMNRAAGDELFAFGGSVLTDAEAAERLTEVDRVFLLAEAGKSTVGDVTREKALLESWGKTLLGVVVIDG